MRKLSITMAAGLLTLISAACNPQTLFGSTCTSEGSYGAQFVTEVTALDANSFHIKAEFLLRNAQAPKYFTPLTFLDGKQYAYQEPVLIDCGETHTWDYEVHSDEPDVHTVNVYAQPDLPVHPEFQKYTPETLPLEHVDLWSIASNHDVISTTLFGDPPELTPTEIPYRRFERDGPTNGWLYLIALPRFTGPHSRSA